MKLCQKQAFQSNSLHCVSPCIDCIYYSMQVSIPEIPVGWILTAVHLPMWNSLFIFLVKEGTLSRAGWKNDHPWVEWQHIYWWMHDGTEEFSKGSTTFPGKKKNVINLEYLFKNKKFQVCSCFVDMLEFLLSDYLM